MTSFSIRYNRWNRPVLTLLGLGPARSSVEVHPGEVRVRMGWAFAATIDRSTIVSAVADDERVWGWGVHGWRDRWLVNGSSDGLVRITMQPPTAARTAGIRLRVSTLRVGVDDREELLRLLAPPSAAPDDQP
jgi:hypothetical protein